MPHPRTLSVLLLLGALPLLAACDILESDDVFEQEYVVESYQVALEPLQPIVISRTAGLDDQWVFEALAVDNADVRVHLLGLDGSVEATFPYRERPSSKGVYVPVDQRHLVLPLRTYALDVTLSDDGHAISAATFVPDTFQVVTTNADTLVYQGTDQLEITVTRSFYPERQNVFVFVSEALDPRYDSLTPFAAAIFDDGEDNLEDFAVGSSPILNEANYDINPDGTLTINLPWLAVAFYGPTLLTANAIDDNLLDFLRSQFVQENGSTLSPGEIPDVISNIDGARGVFGSMAQSVAGAYIARPSP